MHEEFRILFLFRKRLHSHVEYYVSGGGLEKGKEGKIGQKEEQLIERRKLEKIAIRVFSSSLGNQTNPATVTAPGYGRPTGTASNTL